MQSALGNKVCALCQKPSVIIFDGTPLCKKCDDELNTKKPNVVQKKTEVIKQKAIKAIIPTPEEYQLVKSLDGDAKDIYLIEGTVEEMLDEGKNILADLEKHRAEKTKYLADSIKHNEGTIAKALASKKYHEASKKVKQDESDLSYYKALTDGCLKDLKIEMIGIGICNILHAKIGSQWFACVETKKEGSKLVEILNYNEVWSEEGQAYPEVK